MALRVAMTAMPQLVSLFNAVGGGAAAIVALFDYGHVVGTPEEEISTAIFVVLGVVIGWWILKHLPQRIFENVLFWLTAFAAVWLIWG
jgi:NAD/NADP transhydrogenase beta subunit